MCSSTRATCRGSEAERRRDRRPERLVVDVQRRHDTFSQHASTEATRRATADAAVEDELYLIWTPKIEVVANDLLEEGAPRHETVQHLRQRELGLQDGDVVEEVGRSITREKWMRQSAEPLSSKRVDLVGAERIGKFLSSCWVAARQDTVIERCEKRCCDERAGA